MATTDVHSVRVFFVLLYHISHETAIRYLTNSRWSDNDPDDVYYIDPENDPYSTFIAASNKHNAWAILPNPADWEGLELKFFHFPMFTRTSNPSVYVTCQKKKVIYSITGVYFNADDVVEIGTGQTTFKSIGGIWWVVSGSTVSVDEIIKT